mgnify:FL=1
MLSYRLTLCNLAGLPRLDSPPLPMSVFQGPISPRLLAGGDNKIVSPKPVRLQPILQSRIPDATEPWTRSPRKAEMETSTAIWRIASMETLSAKATAGWYLQCVLHFLLIQLMSVQM